MSEYVFKIKKGELEIEISSDDPTFIEEELAKWRSAILTKDQKQNQVN